MLIPYATVYLKMSLEITQGRELFGAHLTLKWFIAGVRSFVYVQVIFLYKTPGAIGTAKWFLSGMGTYVGL